MRLPKFVDIAAASARLHGEAVVTPLLRNAELDSRAGGRVFVKAETLQRTGSFKYRGAFNRLVQLALHERKRGVVAFSSGNHAQGVAAAARQLEIDAVIVMPRDAPQSKIRGTERLGARIVFYDRNTESRESIAEKLCTESGATLVPSFDDVDIIAGQGTVGLEIIEQAGDEEQLDAVLIPCGGGGLTAGCALAFEERSPATQVIAVEPEGFDDTALSLSAAKRVPAHAVCGTICDALMTALPGEITFEINRRLVTRGVVVTDTLVRQAMAFAWKELKLVVEPGGAVALAAVLGGAFSCAGSAIALVLSGGNVDESRYVEALAQ